ncbi:hypothetical protein J437_LFUL018988 [Ladona fulva]|uniref:PiggyBac transposable element-derived protein domain-containing protein n=1 Tax=Ladona fulva TaxID=123851 RepID=A0A8K0P808_LADFU|nr:hypothetical protein J437_LFUL018988 [Ladona fulva]
MSKAHGLLADEDVEYLLLESDYESDVSDDNISGSVEEESSSDSGSEDEETIDVIRSAELNLKNNNEEWKWSKNRRSVTNFEFTASPGVKSTVLRKLGCAPSEVDFFMNTLEADFWNSVCLETNRYADYYLKSRSTRKSALTKEWFKTSADELQSYFALCVLMAQVRKNKIKNIGVHKQLPKHHFSAK